MARRAELEKNWIDERDALRAYLNKAYYEILDEVLEKLGQDRDYQYQLDTEFINKFEILHEAIHYMRTEVTSCLFRYRRPSKFAIEEIRSKSVFMFRLSKQNDPLEYNIVMDPFPTLQRHFPDLVDNVPPETEEWDKALYGRFIMPEVMLDMQARYRDRTHDLYIACFSETSKSGPMWNFYSDEHKGICIQYDLSQFDQPQGCKGTLWPVSYGSSVNIWDSINYTLRSPSLPIHPLAPQPSFQAALAKLYPWNYEQEYRLLLERPDFDADGFIMNGLPIKSVIIGSRCEREFMVEAIAAADEIGVPVIFASDWFTPMRERPIASEYDPLMRRIFGDDYDDHNGGDDEGIGA